MGFDVDIDRYERIWIIISGVVLAALFAVLLYNRYAQGVHMETDIGQIHPAAIETTPPFNEPGLRQIGPNEYEAVIIARAWAFEPKEIRVPVGSTVHFVMTAADVLHGFKIPGTTVNRTVIPGQITKATHRFTEPGRYDYLCHEYCGVGHHVMSGGIIVEQ